MIASTWFMNVAESIIPDDFQPPPPASNPLNRLTLCFLVLDSGVVITGKSPVDPALTEAARKDLAKQDAKHQLFHLEYQMQATLDHCMP